MIEIYFWAAAVTAIALVRPNHDTEPGEYVASMLAGLVWPVVIGIRLYRKVAR